MTELRLNEEVGTSPTGGRGIGDRPRLSPAGVDLVVAIVVFGASVVNVAAQDASSISEIPVVGFLLLASGSVALFWRRRLSVAVLGAALAMTIAWTVSDFPGNPVFHILVSLYAVGRYLPLGKVSLALLVAALAVVTAIQVNDGDAASEVVTALAVTTLPWYVGRRVRARGQHAAVARERSEHLEWRRATEAQRTIADARAAIARELHDVVAHNVSVMTVQAGVARLVVADDPQRAQEAIGAVEQAGRRALDELRQLLGVLRPETTTGDRGPQPALSQVQELVDQLCQTGMRVSLTADIPSELPARLDLFAYRIVQEALTNVLKHGGVDAVAHVRLEQTEGHLTIEVTDTGTATTALPGSGQGIVGMNERAVLLGGTFEAGPLPEGGFRVLARLPIEDQ